MSRSLLGKVAVVTGGARGIGAAIVRRFIEQGAHVVSVDKDFADDIGASAHNHVTEKPNVPTQLPIYCDVSDAQTIAAMVHQAIDIFGRIDILVNNAGRTGSSGTFLEVDRADWDRFIAINLTGIFLVSQAIALTMVERHVFGRIINIGSVNSFAAEPAASPYVASKGGVLALTKAMAVDLAGYGITVNMLAPGPIRVDRNASLFDSEPLRTGISRRLPLGRPGEGDDIAAAAAFLASDDSKFITGASLCIDGGMTALLNYD